MRRALALLTDIQVIIFRDDKRVIGIKTFENMGANGRRFKFCIDLGNAQKTNPKTVAGYSVLTLEVRSISIAYFYLGDKLTLCHPFQIKILGFFMSCLAAMPPRVLSGYV